MATDTNTLNLNSYRPLGSGSGAGTTVLGSFGKPQGPLGSGSGAGATVLGSFAKPQGPLGSGSGAGITMALLRPHRGMKTASSLGMVGPTPPQVLRRGLLRTT